MIYVGGVPFSADDAESSSQGSTMLVALMEHPVLVSASGSVKAIPTWKFTNPEESGSEKSRQSKCVYVFQREYATVDPAYVDFVGTDEATTCVGLAIRNRTSGMTSVSHMDSPNVVDIGLTQMLNSVFNENSDAELDVHLVGGFQDVSPQVWPKILCFVFDFQRCTYLVRDRITKVECIEFFMQQAGGGSRCKGKLEGYSFPLCAKIVETLQSRGERFHLQTLHVLGHNTRWDSAGNACPIFNGFLVETSTGSIFPASFDRTSRCPDEIVRRTRLAACFEDTNLSGRLLEVYDTQTDRFIIAPFFWTEHLLYIASTGEKLSDSEILLSCSTSPFAEGPDFVDNERRLWGFLIENPDWRDMFPMKQPRVFERAESGFWGILNISCTLSSIMKLSLKQGASHTFPSCPLPLCNFHPNKGFEVCTKSLLPILCIFCNGTF